MENRFNYTSIVYDSRKAVPGSAFFCIRGALSDGHKYADSAYEKGARYFFCEEKLDLPEDAVQVIVEDSRRELAVRSREFFDYPDKKLKIIGITGTKGKTTISNVVHQVFNTAGIKTAVIGTNGMIIDGEKRPTENTTPESYELFAAFADMVKCGTTHCVMEVSSQAYKLGRVFGITFDTAVFTNLSPDHLGPNEHADFDEYMLCKACLFENANESIINIDDDFSDVMISHSAGNVVGFSVKNPDSDFYADDIRTWKSESALGVDFMLGCNSGNARIKVPTPGEYSVYNALAVIAVAIKYGVDISHLESQIPRSHVKGRFEIVDALPWSTFIIDYAHNEISLRNVLKTIKEYDPGRLICLFGSVGDRTQIRREELGRIAAKYADFCILTSDNPGFENPMNIINGIEHGIDGKVPYICIPDRKEAVIYAVRNARRGDVILFAGKGHEDYQLINGVKEHFSEREIIEAEVAKIGLEV